MKNEYDELEAKLPLGYILSACDDWFALCEDCGLNPWLLNEGIAASTDTHPIKISILRKHGVLR